MRDDSKDRMESLLHGHRSGPEKGTIGSLENFFSLAELKKENEALLKKLSTVSQNGEQLAALIEGYFNEVALHVLRGDDKYYSATDVCEWLSNIRTSCAILNDSLEEENSSE
ncbi:MAG: hypothetical protein WC682_00405 [Parcubacteria group bacterium]